MAGRRVDRPQRANPSAEHPAQEHRRTNHPQRPQKGQRHRMGRKPGDYQHQRVGGEECVEPRHGVPVGARAQQYDQPEEKERQGDLKQSVGPLEPRCGLSPRVRLRGGQQAHKPQEHDALDRQQAKNHFTDSSRFHCGSRSRLCKTSRTHARNASKSAIWAIARTTMPFSRGTCAAAPSQKSRHEHDRRQHSQQRSVNHQQPRKRLGRQSRVPIGRWPAKRISAKKASRKTI